jgi:hypothetical protein
MRPRSQIDCIANIPMTQDEKLFFKQLGARSAELRKTHGLTQVQLAEALKLTQLMECIHFQLPTTSDLFSVDCNNSCKRFSKMRYG